MSNKKTTREQFKEMVTYLMEEGTDNDVIESYVDTFMSIHNEQTLALDIQAEKLMEKQKRIEGLSKFIMNMNLFDEYCKWKDTEL